MRKALWTLPLIAACLTLPAGAVAAGTRPLGGGTWGTAKELPGIAALNVGGDALVTTLSCGSVGNCGLGGYYTDGSSHGQAFVASETNGTWGSAEEVPGTAALNVGGYALVDTLSCATAGNCSAAGSYLDGSHHGQAFVASETNGTWGSAVEVPGTAAFGSPDVYPESVSCASPGNCSAVGNYSGAAVQVFAVNETNGVWGTAKEMPGLGALNKGGNATVSQVSCGSAGNCAAGGSYTTAKNKVQAFIVNETNGGWHTAKLAPGTGVLNKGGDAVVESVSCSSANNCSAGGTYNTGGHGQVFTIDETGGTWASAQEVPGSAALNTGGGAQMASVSCASAGNCGAVGFYTDSSQNYQAFAVSETSGTWGSAAEIPGTAELNTASAGGNVVSCPSAGDCTVGGVYSFSRAGSGGQGFVDGAVGGIWGNAEPVPGMGELDPGGQSSVADLSCGAPGHCSVGGDYEKAGVTEPFVVGEY